MGKVFNIERYAVHDGFGIRTLVFLKGCPLRCLWCANPEGRSPERQLIYTRQDCIGCRACADACPKGALSFHERDGLVIDQKRCDLCGACTEQCYSGALEFDSREMCADEVMAVVERDLAFYRKSGNGGVTLSGGEPLMQFEFALEIARASRKRGIGCVLETCGHCEWSCLSDVASMLDLVFFDIKHMDSHAHLGLTGVENGLILENLLKLGEKNVPVIVRVPVIPGLNDSAENIRRTARYAKKLRKVIGVELLPYHALGTSKYKKIGLKYPLKSTVPPSIRKMNELKSAVESENVRCITGKYVLDNNEP